MSEYEKVREIFRNSNELIRASDITKHGIDNRADYQWAEDGELGDVEIITRFFPEAVFCMGSALHYYGYVDRTPDRWHSAVSKDSNKNKYKIVYGY